MRLSDWQGHREKLEVELAPIVQRLAQVGGDRYEGCWLDSAKNRVGTNYQRLRWFTGEGKKKGCKVLKGEELVIAALAMELLAERDRIKAQIGECDRAIAAIEAKISALAG